MSKLGTLSKIQEKVKKDTDLDVRSMLSEIVRELQRHIEGDLAEFDRDFSKMNESDEDNPFANKKGQNSKFVF